MNEFLIAFSNETTPSPVNRYVLIPWQESFARCNLMSRLPANIATYLKRRCDSNTNRISTQSFKVRLTPRSRRRFFLGRFFWFFYLVRHSASLNKTPACGAGVFNTTGEIDQRSLTEFPEHLVYSHSSVTNPEN